MPLASRERRLDNARICATRRLSGGALREWRIYKVIGFVKLIDEPRAGGASRRKYQVYNSRFQNGKSKAAVSLEGEILSYPASARHMPT